MAEMERFYDNLMIINLYYDCVDKLLIGVKILN